MSKEQIQHKYIPKNFNSDDTIYHYCELNTAIELILHNLTLRMSPRKNSNDPLENSDSMNILGGFGEDRTLMASDVDAAEIREATISKIKSLKHVCFCMNDYAKDYSGDYMLPYEFYGFLKPRMWDQYADNYNGVCLAFSKKELLKHQHLIPEKIKYRKYDSLYLNESIDLNLLKEKGFDDYFNLYFNKVEEKLFRKHIDYSGENEFRLCAYSKNEYDFIDIRSSLLGIVAPQNNISNFSKKTLNNYVDEYNIDLVYIHWHSDRVNLMSKEEMDILLKNT
jgi:hypothetical protein